ncbi:MAG: DUF1302 domain-containing protein [Nitrincola lacisaponensis]|uniref:Type V secretory pathway, adhesin AidA n=1 Tax=Nitrincola lacisaponensis TaxID=267850 RepID=A0A063Y4D9_9GAMM|nr:DUF1302 domain-containing protein [Nitrincola lacisaponensis]KDE40524.1 hypothetical protein ADINL_1116 [Nitrincola lacisaponensis]
MATQNPYLQGTHVPRRHKWTPTLLTTLLAAGFTAQAQALEFQLGEIQGRFDSNISIGTSIRLDNPDSGLISQPNNGTSMGSGSYDDGTQNFRRGKPFSTVLKGVHDLELRYENVGFFGRGKYWYDYELEKGSRAHGHIPNGYTPNTRLNDSDFNDFAKFSGIELLDAYFYGAFDLGNMPLDLRIGRQAINWGESTFIQGGINAFNPVDVTAFRRPGAELKEGLLPFGSVFASLGLTDNLSVEGFYQYKWEPTVVDGCGTYFSSNDFAPQGCDGIRVFSQLGQPLIDLTVGDQDYFNLASGGQWALNGIDPVVRRNLDGRREGSDKDQFGLSFRYFAENLNNTEFGLYFARYNSRLPMISGINSSRNPGDTQIFIPGLGVIDAATAAGLVAGGQLPPETMALFPLIAAFDSEYYIDYPNGINMTGLSFSTNLGDIAWSGEISHKRNVPIQVNGPLLVGAILRQNIGGVGNTAADQLVQQAGPGGVIQGYGTFDVTQTQTTFIKFFDNVMGASRLTTIAELGWTHVHGLDEGADAMKYGRSGIFGYEAGDTSGFVTRNSYGYVLRGALEYPNAFAGMTLTPELNFRHGVKGNGPEPGAAFRENEKAINIGLTADYMNRYRFGASYTSFFGGSFNAEKDRDYISLNASIAF